MAVRMIQQRVQIRMKAAFEQAFVKTIFNWQMNVVCFYFFIALFMQGFTVTEQ